MDLAAGTATFAALLGLLARRSPRIRCVAAALLALLAGAMSLAWRLESATVRGQLPEQPVTVEGTVGATAKSSGWARVDLHGVVAIDPDAALPSNIRLFEDEAGIGQRALRDTRRGERVRARVRLRAVRDVRNPGARPSARRVRRAGIGAVGSLLHPALFVTLPQRSRGAAGGAVREFRGDLSRRLRRSGSGSELVRALALGDRDDLSPEAWDDFRRLGLAHLLAVSGLHLSLVASLVYAGLRFSLGRSAWLAARRDTRQLALLGGVMAAGLYALLAGWGIPVRRALVLLVALLLAVLRRHPGLRAEPLSAAAIAVLAIDPAALFDAGAQLSFAAAGALALAAPRRAISGTSRLLNRLADATRASATAVVATAPIAAWQLGTSAPLGVFANLLGIPWTAFVLLPSALLAAIAAAWEVEPIGSLCASGAAHIAAWTLELVGAAADALPVLSPPTRPGVGSMLAVLTLVAIVLRLPGTAARLLGALAVSGWLVVLSPESIGPPPPRLVALEVGHGAANIVQGRRAAILVDAGSARGASDWGRRAVVPALAALGIDRLDLLVVSHGDLDHRGGVPSVLDAVPVDEIWIPFGSAQDPAFTEILVAAKLRGVEVRERGAGSAVRTVGELRISALWPQRSPLDRSRNDRSLVVRVEVHGRAILLPGDIEVAAELDLARSGVDLRAEILALPHHGSRTSSSATFLRAVGAEVAIASAPPVGSFELPHPDVLARTRLAGASVWWTGRDGAVLVGLGRTLTAWGYRDRAPGRDGDPGFR